MDPKSQHRMLLELSQIHFLLLSHSTLALRQANGTFLLLNDVLHSDLPVIFIFVQTSLYALGLKQPIQMYLQLNGFLRQV